MIKIYNKNKLTFSLIWIGIYVILASIGDSISDTIGITKVFTAPLLFAMSVVIYFWLLRNDLIKEYGLFYAKDCKSGMLYFIPLTVLITVNLWNGVTLNMPIVDTAFYIISMVFVGFLEEIIFRGFLFKSLIDLGVKKAFVISSVTFGIGHIINLLNGAEFVPTLLQIVSAVTIGFMFTLVYYKSMCLLPCIVTHSLFNSLSAFAVEPSGYIRILTILAICIISITYSFWIMFSKNGLNLSKNHNKSHFRKE